MPERKHSLCLAFLKGVIQQLALGTGHHCLETDPTQLRGDGKSSWPGKWLI